jgi:hypothetical protein
MNTDKDDLVKFLTALALIFGGLGIVGWQVYEYLRYNTWNSASVITALQWMKIHWAMNPTDWIGLHNILSMTPLSLTMIAIGWMVVMSDNN